MSDPTETGQQARRGEASGGRLTSSTPSPDETSPLRAPDGARREIPWRLVGLGVLLVYGILFVVLNSRQVAVSFVFFKPRVSLIVALVLALLIGFLAGYLFDNRRGRQRQDRSSRR